MIMKMFNICAIVVVFSTVFGYFAGAIRGFVLSTIGYILLIGYFIHVKKDAEYMLISIFMLLGFFFIGLFIRLGVFFGTELKKSVSPYPYSEIESIREQKNEERKFKKNEEKEKILNAKLGYIKEEVNDNMSTKDDIKRKSIQEKIRLNLEKIKNKSD